LPLASFRDDHDAFGCDRLPADELHEGVEVLLREIGN
jgi:hypothetical protein